MSLKKHLHILSELSAHPIARNIEWSDLIPALASIGLLHHESNNKYEFSRNGHKVLFEQPRTKMLDIEEVLKLRHFLQSSAQPETVNAILHAAVIVAVDHHNATIFHNPGTEQASTQKLHADLEKGRILHKTKHHPSFGDTDPVDDPQYFEDLIKSMQKSNSVVVLSHGTGSSSAAEKLLAVIAEHHPQVAQKIIAVQKCDLEAMTEPQLIALGIRLLTNKSKESIN